MSVIDVASLSTRLTGSNMLGANEPGVFYSLPNNAQVTADVADGEQWKNERVSNEFSHFIRTFKDANDEYPYEKQLRENVKLASYYIRVSLSDIAMHNSPLHEQIALRPLQVMDALERGICDAYYRSVFSKTYDEVNPESKDAIPIVQLQLFGGSPLTVRQLDSSRMERLVTISAIVVQAASATSKPSTLKIRCKKCDHVTFLDFPLTAESVSLPKHCLNTHNQNNAAANALGADAKCPPESYEVVESDSKFWEMQALKVQELPEHVPAGDMPRPITIYAGRWLANTTLPGSRVHIVGVMTTGSKRGNGEAIGGGVEVKSSHFRVLGMVSENVFGMGGSGGGGSAIDGLKASPEDIQKFKKFALSVDGTTVVDKIVSSIAPSIFSRDDLKKAVACSLFSAPRQRMRDGTYVRGDINVLLLGDPGTAKSQLLKFAQRVAPIGIFTSGKGASAAGLTAAITRDLNGNFALEGGAMVLADGGLVCIDEFDKMRSEDRVAIHEAMEQQTISIAKAGITTVLNSRCAVLAAANPTFGSFKGGESASASDGNAAASGNGNDYNNSQSQHSFESTILSRFDMIFLVKDSMARDVELAKHVIRLHAEGGNPGGKKNDQGEDIFNNKAAMSVDELRSFIHYARNNCTPSLTVEASKMLENHYVHCRQAVAAEGRSLRNIPITVRQLDAIQRISSSLARMELSNEVLSRHVDEAIHLFNTSTMEAIQGGVEVESMSAVNPTKIRQCVDEILARLPLGGRKDENTLYKEMMQIGFNRQATTAAIRQLIKEKTIIEKGNNLQRVHAGKGTSMNSR